VTQWVVDRELRIPPSFIAPEGAPRRRNLQVALRNGTGAQGRRGAGLSGAGSRGRGGVRRIDSKNPRGSPRPGGHRQRVAERHRRSGPRRGMPHPRLQRHPSPCGAAVLRDLRRAAGGLRKISTRHPLPRAGSPDRARTRGALERYAFSNCRTVLAGRNRKSGSVSIPPLTQDVGFYDLEARYGEPGDYAGSDLLAEWYRRNVRIYNNVTKLVAAPEDHVLVIFGAGHLGWLRQDFAADPTLRLRKLKEFVRPRWVALSGADLHLRPRARYLCASAHSSAASRPAFVSAHVCSTR
jgi:hypothetical protein